MQDLDGNVFKIVNVVGTDVILKVKVRANKGVTRILPLSKSELVRPSRVAAGGSIAMGASSLFAYSSVGMTLIVSVFAGVTTTVLSYIGLSMLDKSLVPVKVNFLEEEGGNEAYKTALNKFDAKTLPVKEYSAELYEKTNDEIIEEYINALNNHYNPVDNTEIPEHIDTTFTEIFQPKTTELTKNTNNKDSSQQNEAMRNENTIELLLSGRNSENENSSNTDSIHNMTDNLKSSTKRTDDSNPESEPSNNNSIFSEAIDTSNIFGDLSKSIGTKSNRGELQ